MQICAVLLEEVRPIVISPGASHHLVQGFL